MLTQCKVIALALALIDVVPLLCLLLLLFLLLYKQDVAVGRGGICPAPPPLWMDSWVKSDKVEYYSTLGTEC